MASRKASKTSKAAAVPPVEAPSSAPNDAPATLPPAAGDPVDLTGRVKGLETQVEDLRAGRAVLVDALGAKERELADHKTAAVTEVGLAGAQQTIASLRALLARLQWTGTPAKTPDHRLQGTCPACKQFDRHGLGCELAAELPA